MVEEVSVELKILVTVELIKDVRLLLTILVTVLLTKVVKVVERVLLMTCAMVAEDMVEGGPAGPVAPVGPGGPAGPAGPVLPPPPPEPLTRTQISAVPSLLRSAARYKFPLFKSA